MNIYEQLGRAVDQLEIERQNHRNTVKVLADLKAGRLRLDQVEVDERSLSWQTFPDRAPPEAPQPKYCGLQPVA